MALTIAIRRIGQGYLLSQAHVHGAATTSTVASVTVGPTGAGVTPPMAPLTAPANLATGVTGMLAR